MKRADNRIGNPSRIDSIMVLANWVLQRDVFQLAVICPEEVEVRI
jgi:hypothetical protein